MFDSLKFVLTQKLGWIFKGGDASAPDLGACSGDVVHDVAGSDPKPCSDSADRVFYVPLPDLQTMA
ncbi:hypothetical protein [Rhodoligotrophos defluvii]|uniref:hypothetical protein n=1 Tax=Rhodoligotrophos defluvii TaxID=2561934 RepID=UPI0010CA00E7|nr:hypothetical protein [Rhodoligotrophos defluvii]